MPTNRTDVGDSIFIFVTCPSFLTGDHQGVVAAAAAQHLTPTILELASIPASLFPKDMDGVSLVPVLLSPTGAPPAVSTPLYFEFCTGVHPAGITRTGAGWGFAVRNETWKAVSLFSEGAESGVFLYNLANDIGETKDVAASHPAVVASLTAFAKAAHVDSAVFPMGGKACKTR